jgi:hypothetical protein
MGDLTQKPAIRQVWVGEKRCFDGLFRPQNPFSGDPDWTCSEPITIDL